VPSTIFTQFQTPINADWLNDVNASTYRINFRDGNPTATTGIAAKINYVMEPVVPSFPTSAVAGYWPAPVYVNAAVGCEFNATNAPIAGGPSVGFLAYTNNNNTPTDTVGIMSIAVARTNNDVVFGGNLIVTNMPGNTNSKLVGLEIDVQPASGTTPSTQSAGLYINAFTSVGCGAGIQIDGVFGGSFNNGVLIGNMTAPNAAGLAPVGSAVMDTLINTGSGVYTRAAISLSNTHRVLFQGTGAVPAQLYNDASNFLHVVGGTTGIAFQNSADTITNVFIENTTGKLTLCSTSTINWNAAKSTTTIGAAGGAAVLPATPLGYVTIQVAGVDRKIPYYNS
jgi:hypothetical protein